MASGLLRALLVQSLVLVGMTACSVVCTIMCVRPMPERAKPARRCKGFPPDGARTRNVDRLSKCSPLCVTYKHLGMSRTIVHTVFWKWNGSQPADFIAQLRTAAQGMVGTSLPPCMACGGKKLARGPRLTRAMPGGAASSHVRTQVRFRD